MAADGMKQFKIEEIAAINDGALVLAINKAIHQAYLDCEDRPALATKRTVSLQIGLTPELDNGTRLYRVKVSFELGKTLPKQGLIVAMKPGADGLEFRPEVPDNPDQRTLNYPENDDEG